MKYKVPLKGFIAICKRALKCRYNTVFLTNRMLTQCYDINIDSSVGLHYVLMIPDAEDYDTPFYDDVYVELYPAELLRVYHSGHDYLQDRRKEKKIKPKDAVEELYVSDRSDGMLEFKFLYYLSDELIHTETWSAIYPVSLTNLRADNCGDTFTQMMYRIKPGGTCVILDALRLGIISRAVDTPGPYIHTVKVNGKKIRLVFIKSMFMGTKKWNRAIISVQETVMSNIYLMSMQLTVDGISELFIGYVQNY